MSAPFGHRIVPPSMKKRAKYSGSVSGSRSDEPIGDVNGLLDAVVERELDPVAAGMDGANDER